MTLENGGGETPGVKMSQAVAKTSTLLGGGLVALVPGLAPLGVGIAASSEIAGTTAGLLHQRINRALGESQARRVAEVVQELGETVEREGLEPDREQMDELLVRALPVIANSGRERRRLVADLLRNAARDPELAAAHAEVELMLGMIDQMTEADAIVFATFQACLNSPDACFDPQTPESRRSVPTLAVVEACHLDGFVVAEGIDHLSESLRMLSRDVSEGPAHGVLRATHRGGRLASWLRANPNILGSESSEPLAGDDAFQNEGLPVNRPEVPVSRETPYLI